MTNPIGCEHCGARVEIPPGYDKPFAYCPHCGKMSKTGLTPDPTPRPAEELPEIMRANRQLVGRICPVCLQAIQLGAPVHNCPSCREASHQDCWNRRQGCGNPSCSKQPKGSIAGRSSEIPARSEPGPADFGEQAAELTPPASPSLQIVARESAPLDESRTMPCRWCREPIPLHARRCPVCREMQRDSDRSEAGNRSASSEIPGINRMWGIGIMLFSLGMVLVTGITGIALIGGGNVAPGVTALIFAALFYVLLRLGQGMFLGERFAMYVFGIFALIAFFLGLAIMIGAPAAGISYFIVIGVFFGPPLIAAYSNWEKFHA